MIAAELMPEVDGARPGFAPVGSVARWSYDDGCYKICEVSQYNALTVAVFVYSAGQRSIFTHYAVQLTGGAADIEPTADVFTLREGSVGGSDLAFYINKTDGNKAELYCQCKKYQYVAARLETGFSGNVMVKVDALPATAVEV